MTGLMMLTALQQPSSVEAQTPHTEHLYSLSPPNTLRGRHAWTLELEARCSRCVQPRQMEVVEEQREVGPDEMVLHQLVAVASASQDSCSASDLVYCRICTCLSGF